MTKRVFLTGAAGFIGFHTTRMLLQKGIPVFGIDNFNSYYSPQLKAERSAILEKEGTPVVNLDINDKKMRGYLEDFAPTHFLHLAAQAGVRYSKSHPESYLKSNIDGFISVLENIRLYPQIKLIYASSSSVYGLNAKIPFSTEDTTNHPANLYAATKKSNELMAYAYHHLFHIHAIGLRFFTVYGPYGRPDMAYFSFVEKIKNHEPIHLYNEGKMQRDFTYIDDIVDGIYSALDYPKPYEIFNLGNNQPVALLRFIEILESLLEKKAELIFEAYTPGEVPITFADIEKEKKALNFFPKTSLEEGLKKFITWHNSYASCKACS